MQLIEFVLINNIVLWKKKYVWYRKKNKLVFEISKRMNFARYNFYKFL